MPDVDSRDWFPDGQTYAELAEENAALRRILANALRRGGCPEELLDEAVARAVSVDMREHRAAGG